MEVIYTGLHRTPEEVVTTAVREDVEIPGVSILSGAHTALLPRVIELLRAAEASDIVLLAGGVIRDEDMPSLLKVGVRNVMLQETPPEAVVTRLRELVASRRAR